MTETVYQLSATDHLLFTPKPYTTKIDCKNGSVFPIYLSQVYKIHVPEECHINLHSHTITSHFNIHISPAPLNVPWTLDPMTMPADILLGAALIDRKLNTLEYDLKQLLNETSQKTDFDSMLNKSFDSPFTYPWFIWLAGIIAISSLGLLLFWYCYNSIQSRKYQQTPTLQLIQSAPPNNTQQQHQKQNMYPVPPYNL